MIAPIERDDELLASEGMTILPTSKTASRILGMDCQGAQTEVKLQLENNEQMTKMLLVLQSQKVVVADVEEEEEEDDDDLK